ncbi:microcin C ABC transporter ATPase [Gammaproteobacteria bacterium]|nr:microcin C ABC transporter ATPase [Gammaproteobacteria bacterium]
MTRLLLVENLTLKYLEQTLVDKLSFSLDQGKSLGIVGESGSGKTLTALAICQLLVPEIKRDGNITLLDKRLDQFSAKKMQQVLGREIGFVFQEPMSSLNPLHCIGKQIEETLKLHTLLDKRARYKEVLALLEQVGLSNIEYTRLPHTLSGGQRQRVMIAIAIACKPKLLILDEPTTALDVTVAQQILILLKSLQSQLGLAMIFISHDLNVIKFIADDLLVMRAGVICERGKTSAILAAPKHEYTQELINSAPDGCAHSLIVRENLLDVHNLSVDIERKNWLGRSKISKNILQALSFSIAKGEVLGIVGESGSGKTTLGLAILKLIKAQGSIVYLGKETTNFSKIENKAMRKEMQVVFQDPLAALNPRLKVKDIIEEGLLVHFKHLSKSERYQKILDIIAEVGLSEESLSRYPHAFSGGQRQRINLARALILNPKFIVLDEPTSALDLTLQKRMIALLKDLQAKHGLSYLFISHDLRVIKALCHRVIVLKEGAVIETNDTQALFANPQNSYTKELLNAAFML